AQRRAARPRGGQSGAARGVGLHVWPSDGAMERAGGTRPGRAPGSRDRPVGVGPAPLHPLRPELRSGGRRNKGPRVMNAKGATLGGGVFGLAPAYRLAKTGRRVELFEAAAHVGGLAGWHDYGPFTWDRFYHCILPQDTHLLDLLGDLGLESELRWRETGT